MLSIMESNEFLDVVPLVRLAIVVNNIFGFSFVTFCRDRLELAPRVLTILFVVSSVFNLLFGGLAFQNGRRRVKFGRKQGLQAIFVAFVDAVLAASLLVLHILSMVVSENRWNVASNVLLVYGMFSSIVAFLAHFGFSVVYTRKASKHFHDNIDLECPSCHHTFRQSSAGNAIGTNASYAQIVAKERSSTIASTAANEDGITEGDRLISEA